MAARSSRRSARAPSCTPRSAAGSRRRARRTACPRAGCRTVRRARRRATRARPPRLRPRRPPAARRQSTATRRTRPSSTSPSTIGRIAVAPPRNRQCSAMPRSVIAPRPSTARSTYPRRNSSSDGVGASRSSRGMTRSGQVVDALEAVASGDGELAGGEEMLERALRRLPAPHRARIALALERTRGQRAALADRVEHVLLRLAVLALAAPPVRIREMHHAPLEERVVLDGHETCLVRPVLEDPALAEQPRDGAGLVPAEPRGEREPVSAIDRRDGVELHGRQPPDLARHVRGLRRPCPRRVSVVRDEESPELRDRDGQSSIVMWPGSAATRESHALISG